VSPEPERQPRRRLVAPARQPAPPQTTIAEAPSAAILESRALPFCHRLREEQQGWTLPPCHTDSLGFEQSSFIGTLLRSVMAGLIRLIRAIHVDPGTSHDQLEELLALLV